jgi:GNAT superfamily N-acetyltransferase
MECSHTKPHPAPFLAGLELLEGKAGCSVAFEDSSSGVLAAVAAGIPTVGVLTTASKEALVAAGASLTVADFADPALIPFLQRVMSTASNEETVTMRPGTRADAPALLRMIRELAEYEKELDQCLMTVETLATDGWPTAEEATAGREPRFRTLFAEDKEGGLIGFALYFHNYSTWEGMGIYLEDLYVMPASRGFGVGTALIRGVASVAEAEGCTRFQWQCIDFNTPSIEYYKRLGARERVETPDAATPNTPSKWLSFIMDKDALQKFVHAGKR